ncbi:hypothetical protein JCM10550A_04130 [Methanogenium cariaci]
MYHMSQQKTGHSEPLWGSDFLRCFHVFPDMTTLFDHLRSGIGGQNEHISCRVFLQGNDGRNVRYLPKTRRIADH